MNENLLEKLSNNAYDILKKHYHISNSARVLIIYDEETQLAINLKDAFSNACSKNSNSFDIISYYKTTPEEIFEDVQWNSREGDVVVLIQSSSFRASKFRLRNDLCAKGLKVVEFGHLQKIKEDEYETYVNSLYCDDEHNFKLVDKLMNDIKNLNSVTIISENGSEIKYNGKLDNPISNDGRYEGQTNYGSRYPIGEVISEGLDLYTLSGEMEVYAYPSIDTQETVFVEPFTIKVENGLVVSHNGPKDFDDIIELVKTEHPENHVYVREIGLGLNRGIPRFSRLGDPIAYERQEGLHFSIGMKHGIYQKKLWPKYGKKFNQRFHIDVYVNVKEIYFDSQLVYEYPKGYLFKV